MPNRFTRHGVSSQEKLGQPVAMPVAEVDRSSLRKVVLASFVGTVIEWYDFYLYGTAAALVFNKLFFPDVDPLTGTMAAFGTYAVGFFARPLGGIVFGHYGDKIGRKSMLVATLMMMGVATFLIGLLPTYRQIGALAVLAFPIIMMVDSGNIVLVWAALILGFSFCVIAMFAPEAAFFSELFQTNVRYSGASLGYQLAAALGGGLAPIIATALLKWTNGGSWSIAVYLIILAILGLAAVSFSSETFQRDLGKVSKTERIL